MTSPKIGPQSHPQLSFCICVSFIRAAQTFRLYIEVLFKSMTHTMWCDVIVHLHVLLSFPPLLSKGSEVRVSHSALLRPSSSSQLMTLQNLPNARQLCKVNTVKKQHFHTCVLLLLSNATPRMSPQLATDIAFEGQMLLLRAVITEHRFSPENPLNKLSLFQCSGNTSETITKQTRERETDI